MLFYLLFTGTLALHGTERSINHAVLTLAVNDKVSLRSDGTH